MTTQEYKDLLLWCRSKLNQRTKEFNERYEIKTQAVKLQQQISHQKHVIGVHMRNLEMAKHDDVKAKFISWIDQAKDAKKKLMDEFRALELPATNIVNNK